MNEWRKNKRFSLSLNVLPYNCWNSNHLFVYVCTVLEDILFYYYYYFFLQYKKDKYKPLKYLFSRHGTYSLALFRLFFFPPIRTEVWIVETTTKESVLSTCILFAQVKLPWAIVTVERKAKGAAQEMRTTILARTCTNLVWRYLLPWHSNPVNKACVRPRF